jgi:hypothetical protein
LADWKDVFIGTKTGSGKSLSYESIPVPSLFTFRYFYLLTYTIIFASQGLRFGSPFSPPLADLEYILKFASQSESFCYTYVGELKMAAPSEEKLICDKFNLEALTVVTATSTRIQSEDVLHGAHVIDEM